MSVGITKTVLRVHILKGKEHKLVALNGIYRPRGITFAEQSAVGAVWRWSRAWRTLVLRTCSPR